MTEMFMHAKTPKSLTGKILRFCAEFNLPKALFVEMKSFNFCIAGECYGNVDKLIKSKQGEKVIGWRIFEWPDKFIEAELHAIWKSPSGELLDITPIPDEPDCKKSLFVYDENKDEPPPFVWVDNLRLALRDEPCIHGFLQSAEERMKAQIRTQIPGTFRFTLSPEYIQAEFKMRTFISQILSLPKLKIGRNDPCICGSGKKYKKCCV